MRARLESFGVALANPTDADWTRHRYLFSLGAYGWTKVLVWANDGDAALEVLGEWCVEHAPGLLCNDEVQEEFERAKSEGLGEEEAWEQAEVDTVRDNCGNYWHAWELSYVVDPTRAQILAVQHEANERPLAGRAA